MIISTTNSLVILDMLRCPDIKKRAFSYNIENNLYNCLNVGMTISVIAYKCSCVVKTKNAFINQVPDNFPSLFN